MNVFSCWSNLITSANVPISQNFPLSDKFASEIFDNIANIFGKKTT